MAELYKLLFDLSLYYTLTGCFLPLVFHAAPSGAGFFALVAAVGLDALLRRSKSYTPGRSVLPLFLPLVIFFLRTGLWPILQILPPWAYLGWCFLKGNVETEYQDFSDHFGFGTKLLFLLAFGTLALDRFKAAFLTALPYLVLMLSDGVCLLRMLRERKEEGLRQAIYMTIFLVISAGLALGKAPQLLIKGIGLAYNTVILPLIFVLALGIAYCCFGLYALLNWLVSHSGKEPVRPQMQMESMAELLGIEEEYRTYAYNFTWLKILLIAVAIGVVVLFLFLLFRKLLGDGNADRDNSPYREEREKYFAPEGKNPAPGRIRPRNPRLAVRFYYRKYLTECRRRGREIPRGRTVEELPRLTASTFPGADPGRLAALYIPARYSQRELISAADADQAAECWNELKRARPPKIK